MSSRVYRSLFVTLAALLGTSTAVLAQHHEPSAPDKAPAAQAERVGYAYPFNTCPVSGKKFGSMGDPVVKVYDGREVRFCCPACPPTFEKDLAGNLAKLDEKIMKDQEALYPLKTSIVSDKALGEHPVQFVYGNRLVRVADESEKSAFMKDSKKYLELLDKAVIEQQSKDYPLKTCVVSKEELGGMGEAKNVVVAGRLIRLCCNDCKKDVESDPAKFVAVVDAARKEAGGNHAKPNQP